MAADSDTENKAEFILLSKIHIMTTIIQDMSIRNIDIF